jgi:bifunctional DNA-binding transcriptional regulator/antitoxin component of YhaV-PrlF toxin-antitoxin module
MRVKLRKFKEKLGVVFPEELIASLRWEPGDILEVTVENGDLKIVRVETASDRCMRIVDELMEEYHDTLQTLAKP